MNLFRKPFLFIGALFAGGLILPATAGTPAKAPSAVIAAPSASEQPASAQNEVLWRAGYAQIIYDPEVIPTLGLKVGYKTLILLPADEKIVRPEIGLRGTAMEAHYGSNWVALRPNIEHLTTNLHIATDAGRVYSFNLVESGGPHKEPYEKVVVLRPDMDLDADGGPAAPDPAPQGRGAAPAQDQPSTQAMSYPVQVNGRNIAVEGMGDAAPVQLQPVPGVPGAEVIRKLDDDYKIRNQKAKVFRVDRVYNDGSRTFVVFKSQMLEAPLFYRVDTNGKREILSYRIEPAKDNRDPDVFIIPRLVDRGTVKVGDYESTFVWRKAE